MIKADNSPFVPFHLLQKFFLSFNHIWAFMPIMVYSFLYVFADITQFFQPIYGSAFANAAIFFGHLQCQKDDIIDMATEQMRCDGTEILCSEVPSHCVEYSLVVKQSILTVMRIHFGWGQVMMLKKVSFFFPNLMCKIDAFAHALGNCKAGI
jgi:hypothetical protein